MVCLAVPVVAECSISALLPQARHSDDASVHAEALRRILPQGAFLDCFLANIDRCGVRLVRWIDRSESADRLSGLAMCTDDDAVFGELHDFGRTQGRSSDRFISINRHDRGMRHDGDYCPEPNFRLEYF